MPAPAGRASNVWGEGKDTVIHTKGHHAAASTLAAKLIKADYDVSYAYRMRYENGLPHAFINTLLYLDYDRKGFPYPVVPFHVNCYGSSVIAKRGSTAHLTGEADPNLVDPPGPNPRRCFDVGGAVARALADSPWRVALDRLVELVARVPDAEEPLPLSRQCQRPGALRRTVPRASSRAGASCPPRRSRMPASRSSSTGSASAARCTRSGASPQIVDYIESYIFNSDKCFALFPA